MLNWPKIVNAVSTKHVMFRYHKVKTNGGRLREKIAAVLFVLTAFTILGGINTFPILLATGRFSQFKIIVYWTCHRLLTSLILSALQLHTMEVLGSYLYAFSHQSMLLVLALWESYVHTRIPHASPA
jgi:hypothetical protein